MAQQQRYWTGGSGQWSDSMHWAATPGGPAGAGVPRTGDVVIMEAQGSRVVVDMDRDAAVAGLHIGAATGSVVLRGGTSHFRIGGDFSLKGNVMWELGGTVELDAGNAPADLDLNGLPLRGDLRITGGTWNLRSDLMLGDGRLVDLQNGTLATHGHTLKAGRMAMAAQGGGLLPGGSVILLDEPMAMPSAQDVSDFANSTLLIAGRPVDWATGQELRGAGRATVVCGTGPGEVEYTVEVDRSDFSGYGVSCFGACDGRIEVQVSGGVGPFRFRRNLEPWTSDNIWENVCGSASPYGIIVEDLGQSAQACYVQMFIQAPPLLNMIVFQEIPPGCQGECNGSIQGQGVGGAGGLIYDWNNGAGHSPSFNALCPGENFLTVADINGCSFDTIFEFPAYPIVPHLTFQDAECSGGCSGTASVAPEGGSGVYTFEWGPGLIDEHGTDVAGLCAGDHWVIITDVNGCIDTSHFHIDEPPGMDIIVNTTDVACGGTCTGEAHVVVQGGTGTYAFTWLHDPGLSGDMAGGLCEGDYTVRVEDLGSGCFEDVTFGITAPPALELNPASTDVSCFGLCDGEASVQPSGGTTPYSYSWDQPTGHHERVAENLCPGSYTVTVVDWNSCQESFEFVIDGPEALEVSISATDIACGGACTGEAEATVTGGVSPFDYSWGPGNPDGQGTEVVTNLCEGPISLQVTDANGCTADDAGTISAPPPLVLDGSHTDASCGGGCDGTATVTAIGGTGPFGYAWSPDPDTGQGTDTAEDLCPDTYTVTVTDAAGCMNAMSFEIEEQVGLDVEITAQSDVSCYGLCDGSASLAVNGGSGIFTYSWSHDAGLGAATVDNLCAGTYTVLVEDVVSGCSQEVTIVIDGPEALEVSFSHADATCGGECTGEAEATVSGGVEPYGYSWGPDNPVGQGTNLVSGLCEGQVVLQVSDGRGCTIDTFVVISAPDTLFLEGSYTDASCGGGCDGAATVTAIGGTGPFGYAWSPDPDTGQGTDTAEDLCPDTYTVTVTDAAGCMNAMSFEIEEQVGLDVEITAQSDVSCYGLCDGSASLAVNGGSGIFTYSWSHDAGLGAATADNLCAGTYTVLVEDVVSGCSQEVTIVIDGPEVLEVSFSHVDATCGGECTGEAEAMVSGGVEPYGYSWGPDNPVGQGTNLVSGLCEGQVVLQVSDGRGCTIDTFVVISAPDTLFLEGSYTDASCGGGCDGAATVTAIGGTGPFGYAWSPDPDTGQGTDTAEDLCPDTYTVTVTDAAGCMNAMSFEIEEQVGLDVEITAQSDVSCYGLCDGSASLAVNGGSGIFTYSWSHDAGLGAATADNLCAGTYTVLVEDVVSGCSQEVTIVIDGPEALEVSFSHADATCGGECTGEAEATVSGGVEPYGYSWGPDNPVGQGTNLVSGLCEGQVVLQVSDGRGCTIDTFVVISAPDTLFLEGSYTDASCGGGCDGTATVTAIGGTGPFGYAWSPDPDTGQGTDTAEDLCPDTYTVTVTDAAGCMNAMSFEIEQDPGLEITSMDVVDSHCGLCDGSIQLVVQGGAGPLEFQWGLPLNETNHTGFVDGLCAGYYPVTITDGAGCSITANIPVTDSDGVELTMHDDTICAGGTDGTVSVDFTCSDCIVAWVDLNGNPLATGVTELQDLGVGGYIAVVVNGAGCVSADTAFVTEATPMTVVADVEEITCAGAENGRISLDVQTGDGPFAYSWNPVPINGQGGPVAEDLGPGTWEVVITEGNGCSVTQSFTLTDPAPLNASFTAEQAHCGLCDGEAQAAVSGGSGASTVEWNGPGGSYSGAHLTGLCAGVYTATVTDANGCTVTGTVAVTDVDGEEIEVHDGQTLCGNACNGEVGVTYVCNDPPCMTTWYDMAGTEVGTGNTVGGLCEGSYMVVVTNQSGCMTVDTAHVAPSQILGTTLDANMVSCYGVCDGSATVTPTGGSGTYTYAWAHGPAGQGPAVTTGLCAGTYQVDIEDVVSGCTATVVVEITGPAPLVVDATITENSCAGVCDGIIDLDVQGGTGGLGFMWSPQPGTGQGTAVAGELCADTYTVTIVDANNCTYVQDLEIVGPAPLSITTTAMQSHCSICDGELQANVIGGTGTPSIDWDGPGGSYSGTHITDLCAGVYTATVTDANNCIVIATAAVTDVGGEVIDVIDGQVLCSSVCDGTVGVSFMCGDAPCTTTWFDGAGNVIGDQNALQDLCVGTYVVQVVNNSGCVAMDTAYVAPSYTIEPNLSTTPVTCADSCNATATVGPTGGVAPYTFSWTPAPGGAPDQAQATGLCAGTYTVIIEDDAGCQLDLDVFIADADPIDVVAQIQHVSCPDANDGAIVLTASGGAGLFSYEWDPVPPNGQGSNGALDLGPGEWSVTVTDFNGCSVTHSYIITEPDPIGFSVLSTTPSTCSVCNGTAQVEVTGGSPGHDVTWTLNGVAVGTGMSVTDLCAGIYTVQVSDANNCSGQWTVVIGDAGAEQLTTTDFTLNCASGCEGEVSVDFNCSDPDCVIAWFDLGGNDLGEDSATLSNLCAGTYLVQVTNASGCVAIDTAYVHGPTPIVLNLTTTPESCPNACDGGATVEATGGMGGFTYAWNINGTIVDGPQVADLCAGTYSVVATDLAGCSETMDFLITSPDPVTATAVVGQITCHDACDGSIHVTAQGGAGGYTYLWQPEPGNGQFTSTATELCDGPWEVTVADSNGCATSFSVVLNNPPPMSVDLVQTDNVCYNDCLAEASVTITGGVPGYSIEWFDQTGNLIGQDLMMQGLCRGDYEVVVRDTHGCEIITPFTIGSGDAIEAGLNFIGESCFGPCDGTAAVQPSGGAGSAYHIAWSPLPPGGVQGAEQIDGLCPDDYMVTITDALGCDTTHAFTINPYQDITSVATVGQVACHGDCDGSIDLITTGGAGTLTFQWTPEPGTGQGTANVGALCPDDYTVIMTDPAGCADTAVYTINEPPLLEVVIDTVVGTSCNNAADGAISISISGGVPNYTISWAGPNAFESDDEDISGLSMGNYVLVVTDQNNCTFYTVIVLGTGNDLVADAGEDRNECLGTSILLDGSNSQWAATYSWTDLDGVPVGDGPIVDLGALAEGTYLYILTVTNGPCTDTDTVEVTVMPLPIADAGPDQSIYMEGTVVLGGSPAGPWGSVFIWQPDSLLDQGDIPNPTATLDQTTWFQLTVMALDGCTSTDSVLITVIPRVIVHSGFTPNNDGYNDTWTLGFEEAFPNIEVSIFSRWGEPLFHSIGYARPWDGRYDGKPVPVGTYYYVIDLHDDRFPEPLTGPLTIIR